ncbi:hypothetical protein [Pantoea ananatis]|uniref:hypothetical protein n=1 Tax=Pantoea ananas TaxID=553 RepID=UPI0013757853|nr:hypothetical protein [Pantoea ananatis]NCU06768.1 hypothetical protein [Pantoea ananatis]
MKGLWNWIRAQDWYTLISLFIVVTSLVIYAYCHYKKPEIFDYPYSLLAPPVIISIGLAPFYKRFEGLAEFIFSLAASLSALTLCLDALPKFDNKLFPIFFNPNGDMVY